MPQETNLNVAPYFDDFDPQSNFQKVLFKPAYPIQARELNNLQSILQNQIEEFGNSIYKEGSVVIPGNVSYSNDFYAIQIQSEFLGIPVSLFLDQIVGKIITGRTSGVTAKVISYITNEESENGNYTLYINYLNSSSEDSATQTFSDSEILVTNDVITYGTSSFISAGEGFASTIAEDAAATGSAFEVNAGIYFIRGNFLTVDGQILILDQYTNNSSYRIGFTIKESLVNSDEDPTLTDNAQGFNNFTAPGADRLKITATLSKKELTDYNDQNFIQISTVENGVIRSQPSVQQYSALADKLARRTFDESGDYYIKEFITTVRESLNDTEGNRGLFESNQTTPGGNVPSDDLMVYKVSPGKAYVKGYEVDIKTPTLLDVPKARTTKTLKSQAVNFSFGPTLEVNRVYGSPIIGFNTTNTLSLRDERVGDDQKESPGKEIGITRIYDFNLESGSYDSTNPNVNRWDLSLFDTQTYTEFTINEGVVLSASTYIEGESSGASAFARYDVNSGVAITAYNSQGTFVADERLKFNGVLDDSRYVTNVRKYNISDAKSVYGKVGSANTFSADLVQKSSFSIGIASVSQRTLNGDTYFSDITSPSLSNLTTSGWSGIAQVGNLVTYSNPTSGDPSFARITVVTDDTITVTGVTTVSGVCEGTLPTSDLDVTNLSIIRSSFQSSRETGNRSNSEGIYSVLPKSNVSDVKLSGSIVVRKIFSNVSINSNGVATINVENPDTETFLSFDEERYSLIRSDGSTEVLTKDKFEYLSGSTTVQIGGLSAPDVNAVLIATVRKSGLSSKTKLKNQSRTVLVDKSKNAFSGTGETTNNDGLSYGNYPFGTRVQDSVICLNVPDVIKVYGVFESNSTSNPESPSMTTGLLNGPSATTNDLIIGETIIGEISGARAIYLTRKSDSSVGFVYLNNTVFQKNETISFDQSGVTAVASNISLGSKNITSNYTLDQGQRGSFYDYSRLVRKSNTSIPSKKVIVYFSSAYYNTDDSGDITTANSYQSLDYSKEISKVDGFRLTDIIDARPRVSDYVVAEGSKSPFEFDGRTFDNNNHSSKDIISSDESIDLEYSFYLPRRDKVYVKSDGSFSVVQGAPAESPVEPNNISESLLIAKVEVPAYTYSAENCKVSYINHKRYQMSDISRLENRIKNIEYYTSLNILESSTLNTQILDENGSIRFKSGIFVDDFSSLYPQDTSIGVRNSVDLNKKVLRSPHYATQLSLQVGSQSVSGITGSTDLVSDSRYTTLSGSNISRSSLDQVVTLDYSNSVWLQQPFATRLENVTPFLVQEWDGSIVLQPDTDVWIDTNRLESRDTGIVREGNFDQVVQSLGAEISEDQDGNRIGISPTVWGSWETVAERTIDNPDEVVTTSTEITTTSTETTFQDQSRSGTFDVISEQLDTESIGDSLISREIINFLRSRNIEFTSTKLKPFTQVYAFFDSVDVTKFCVPKLLEIEMVSGSFSVGETVEGVMSSTLNSEQLSTAAAPAISFRVASPNHKYGPYNDPTDFYDSNPYSRDSQIQVSYTESSNILNVDTFTLQSQDFPDFSGYVAQSMTLTGKTSGASAVITNVRLLSDRVGTLIGSFRVPDTSNASNPSFETGKSLFRITSSSINSLIPGVLTTSAQESFYSSGTLDTTQENTVSVRNARVTTDITGDVRTLTGATVITNIDVENIPQPAPRRDPLAQTFYVDDVTGVYLTKVDVYFQSKDTALPVTCQIRETLLGTPTETVIPFSEVDLYPENITVSEDGSVASSFVFDTPVYVNGTKEYALVLLSNSTEYKVWISRLGESDVSTLGTEAGQIIVSEQPTLGSLFKSQNGSTWTPSQYEDLKFIMYRANFVESGTVQFYNPKLPKDLELMKTDPITSNPRRISVGIGTTVVENDLTVGSTISQNLTNAQGTLIGLAGSATDDLNIVNAGVGYTPLSGQATFSGVALTSITGSGLNALADITIENGVAIAATISDGGKGYQVGDVLTPLQFGLVGVGDGMKLSVSSIYGSNELLIDEVQGEFEFGPLNWLTYTNSSSEIVDINTGIGGSVFPVSPIRVENDGLHLNVFQRNHGMNSTSSIVKISNIKSDVDPTVLSNNYSRVETTSITVADASNFAEFENIAVSVTNPGYIKIGSEIIEYTGVNGNDLTGITARGVDGSLQTSHTTDNLVYKYEFNGVSLRRINKTHNLSDATVDNPITIDTYNIKIDMSQNGTDRSESSATFDALYFNSSIIGGGNQASSTYNIPYSIMVPDFRVLLNQFTDANYTLRSQSGNSISGNESPYQDLGFEEISLNGGNYFTSLRSVYSGENEDQYLQSLPGNKSFNINVNLTSRDNRLTPVIDLNHSSIILVSNRVNSPDVDFITDPRINNTIDDPNNMMYVTKNIKLENPATSIKVYIDAYISNVNDFRLLYSVDSDRPVSECTFTPFPGYSNIDDFGNVINSKNNDGTSDKKIAKQDILTPSPIGTLFKEYEFTIDDVDPFENFRIKLVATSTNQAISPQFKKLRVITLA